MSEAKSSALNDAAVAEYLGLTPDQVRVIRQRKEYVENCKSCGAIHPTYPQIRFFHHPGCKEVGKCRGCGLPVGRPGENYTHEVGVICSICYHGDSPDDIAD